MKLSIVIPTYNEGKNVRAIAEQIEEVLYEQQYEIVFVDDSNDETTTCLEKLATENTKVKVIHRENERGLATAVIRGFHDSKGEVITVMDADLQHPPSLLPVMLNEIEKGVDIVIPSRFVPGGSDGGLNAIRKIISWGARVLGKLCIHKLRPFTDVTSGYFMMRREVIDNVELSPIGWKILMEVLVRGHYGTVKEIPYAFKMREIGNSKMSFKEQKNYLKHLGRLMCVNSEDLRFLKFAFVGLMGTLINTIIYIIFVYFSVPVVIAGGMSAVLSMIFNFVLNNYFTWKGEKASYWFLRFMKYMSVNLVGIGFNMALLALFYTVFKVNYIASNLLAIILVMLWNYVGSSRWVFKN